MKSICRFSQLHHSIQALQTHYRLPASPADLYSHLLDNPALLTPDRLAQLPPDLLYDHLILLGTHYHRKKHFSKSRALALKCLSQLPLELGTKSVQLLIALSNLNIYSPSLIQRLVEEKLPADTPESVYLQIFASLLRINYKNDPFYGDLLKRIRSSQLSAPHQVNLLWLMSQCNLDCSQLLGLYTNRRD